MNAATALPTLQRTTRHEMADRPVATVDIIRARGVVAIAALGWVSLAVLSATTLFLNHDALPMVFWTGLAMNIAPTIMAAQGRCDAAARAVVATLAAAMPALLVYVLRGHPWQMDGHMYFFVALAGLIVLCDWKPIAIASLLIAAHHLLLIAYAPDFAFAGVGTLGRVAFHALAVLLQFSLLGYAATRLDASFGRLDAAMAESRALVDVADAARASATAALDKAEAAQHQTEAERAQRRAIEQRISVERNAELKILASEFERSVTSVVKSIENAAFCLETSASNLSDIAGRAGTEAGDVAISAAQATEQIRGLASSLQGLGASISTIAASADQQHVLTTAASGQGRDSVAAISSLVERAEQIDGFVETIRSIASTTNLLALNATIEAARAGDAGRGFAVVAAEIKTLATNAARAGDNIATLLTGVRNDVTHSATKIGEVTTAVDDVSQAAGEIAVAVSSQRGYSAQIGDNATRVTTNADLIEHRIGRVASAVASASTLAAEVRTNAEGLTADAKKLRASTDQFVKFLLVDTGP